MMSQRRSCRGSAISETGPALFLLMIIIFFPLIDFIEMGVAYIFASIHHDYMIRELATSFPGPASPGPAAGTPGHIQSGNEAITKTNNEFKSSSFYNFLKNPGLYPTSIPGSAPGVSGPCVQYLPPGSSNPTSVQCATVCVVQPFISIPWWGNAPGLNAPFPVVISSERPQEEKGRD